MQTYIAFLVPAGLAVFAAILGTISVILSKRQIAARLQREQLEAERQSRLAYG
jgi:hypothetical protein